MVKWTPHLDEEMLGYVAQGLSYMEIAKRMGDGQTRGTISGRISRLGKRLKNNSGNLGRHMKTVPEIKSPRPMQNQVAYGTPTSLLNLAKNQCHWPVTEQPILFCAAECEGVYCSQHMERSKRNGNY